MKHDPLFNASNARALAAGFRREGDHDRAAFFDQVARNCNRSAYGNPGERTLRASGGCYPKTHAFHKKP